MKNTKKTQTKNEDVQNIIHSNSNFYRDPIDDNLYSDIEALNFSMSMDNLSCGMIVCSADSDYHILHINNGFANLLGYNCDEIQEIDKKSCFSLTYAEDYEFVKQETHKQLNESKEFRLIYRMIKKDNSIIWVESQGLIIDRENQPSILQCIVSDITALKTREDALIISEKRYELIRRYTDVTPFEYNIKAKELHLHKLDSQEYNLPLFIDNAIETFSHSEIITQESSVALLHLFKRLEKGEATASSVVNVINRFGEHRVLELSLANIFDRNEVPILAVGIKKDITNEMQLQKDKDFADTLLSDKIFAFEANITKSKVISYNENWIADFSTIPVDKTNYTKFINFICNALVHPDHAESILEYLSSANILKAFKKGERLISHNYLQLVDSSNYKWFENFVNIIQDYQSKDITVRCYLEDISERKESLIDLENDQIMHEKFIPNSNCVYQVNVSNDKVVLAHKTLMQRYKLLDNGNYEQMLGLININSVFPPDQAKVLNIFSRENILKTFKEGKEHLNCEIRMLTKEKDYIWVHCYMNLFLDSITNDIIGYSYFEDIDKAKRNELQLIYNAEHDSLTKIYNKANTEKYIAEFLATCTPDSSLHGFLIIDIDYFKAVNDNFGHAFGDIMLVQTSKEIIKNFCDEDIIGRIGGDEFVVLVKNIPSESFAIQKAEKVCKAVFSVFTRYQTNIKNSVSIGIAFYGKHGTTYQELYENSDSALYKSKDNGRNQYTVYNSEKLNNLSDKSSTKSNDYAFSRKFTHNISEQVFRILYKANDEWAAINSVLELLGKHYNVSRAYIYEDDKNRRIGANYQSVINTFEWSKGEINREHEVVYIDFEEYMKNFDDNGIFHITDIDKLDTTTKNLFKSLDIKSCLQFIFSHNEINKGIIGFDECLVARRYSEQEISELSIISSILELFLSKSHIDKTSKPLDGSYFYANKLE